ncbi:MAG: hypothetical protein KBA64_02000 [Armatimonadetes bacterium]|nr:hypothetical protein [Armatimonadota bacterium]
MPSSPRRRSNPVTFRLDEATEKVLRDRAEALGCSPGEHARRLVVEGLMGGGEVLQLRDELVELRTEVSRLRQVVTQLQGLSEIERLQEAFGQFTDHFKLSVLALLVGGGQMELEEARAWVNKNLAEKLVGG